MNHHRSDYAEPGSQYWDGFIWRLVWTVLGLIGCLFAVLVMGLWTMAIWGGLYQSWWRYVMYAVSPLAGLCAIIYGVLGCMLVGSWISDFRWRLRMSKAVREGRW